MAKFLTCLNPRPSALETRNPKPPSGEQGSIRPARATEKAGDPGASRRPVIATPAVRYLKWVGFFPKIQGSPCFGSPRGVPWRQGSSIFIDPRTLGDKDGGLIPFLGGPFKGLLFYLGYKSQVGFPKIGVLVFKGPFKGILFSLGYTKGAVLFEIANLGGGGGAN